MKCDVCGCEFTPRKKDKIIIKDVSRLDFCATYWDAFECPGCGCQIIARKHCEKVDKADVFKPWNVKALEHIEKTCVNCDYCNGDTYAFSCKHCKNHSNWRHSGGDN